MADMRGMIFFPLLCFTALSWGQVTREVTAADYRFEPAEVRIKPGDTVRWTNTEKRANHSVLFTGPQGYETDRIFPGESVERVFTTPGRYPYTCGPHPEMKGLVIVE
jgi:plastocyanin